MCPWRRATTSVYYDRIWREGCTSWHAAIQWRQECGARQWPRPGPRDRVPLRGSIRPLPWPRVWLARARRAVLFGLGVLALAVHLHPSRPPPDVFWLCPWGLHVGPNAFLLPEAVPVPTLSIKQLRWGQRAPLRYKSSQPGPLQRWMLLRQKRTSTMQRIGKLIASGAGKHRHLLFRTMDGFDATCARTVWLAHLRVYAPGRC